MVITKGSDVGHCEYELHHDVDTKKLMASIRQQRKNVKAVGISISGRLIVKADLSKLRSNTAAALLELDESLRKQVEHVNAKARRSGQLTVA